jgi:hypothetical protein
MPKPNQIAKFEVGDIIKWIYKEPPDYECWPDLDYITKGDCFLILKFIPGAKSSNLYWNFYEVLDMSRNQKLTVDSDMLEVSTWAKRVYKI